MIGDQVQRAGAGANAQQDVQRLAPRGRVIAIAPRIEHRCRHVVTHGIAGATQARAEHERVVTGEARLQPGVMAFVRDIAPCLDHATGGIAMQGRERAPQHLHAIRTQHAEVRYLALTVGHGRRHAVGVQPHATHAESGPRAEAADRQLGVLREVLPFARLHARYAVQHFRERGLRACASIPHRHHADRGGRIECGDRFQPRRGHHYTVQGLGRAGCAGLFAQRRGRQCGTTHHPTESRDRMHADNRSAGRLRKPRPGTCDVVASHRSVVAGRRR